MKKSTRIIIDLTLKNIKIYILMHLLPFPECFNMEFISKLEEFYKKDKLSKIEKKNSGNYLLKPKFSMNMSQKNLQKNLGL